MLDSVLISHEIIARVSTMTFFDQTFLDGCAGTFFDKTKEMLEGLLRVNCERKAGPDSDGGWPHKRRGKGDKAMVT